MATICCLGCVGVLMETIISNIEIQMKHKIYSVGRWVVLVIVITDDDIFKCLIFRKSE